MICWFICKTDLRSFLNLFRALPPPGVSTTPTSSFDIGYSVFDIQDVRYSNKVFNPLKLFLPLIGYIYL